jgi:hypothetical protein
MLEHCHGQCVAMVMKGYRLTLREWLLFGPDGDILFEDSGCSGASNGGTPPAMNPFLRLAAMCPVFKEVDKDQYCVARSLLLLDYVESVDVSVVGGWSPTLPLRPLHQKTAGAFLGLLQDFNDSVSGYYITNRKVVKLGFDDHYAKKVQLIVDEKQSGIAEVAVEDLETTTGVRSNHCMAVKEGILIEPSDGSTHAWPYPAAGERDQRWLRGVILFIPLVKIARNKRKGGPAPQPFLARNKRQTVTRTSTTTTTTSTTASSTVTTTHTFTDNELMDGKGVEWDPVPDLVYDPIGQLPGLEDVVLPAEDEDMTRQSTGTNDVAFQIFAKTLSGKSVSLRVDPTTTVMDLKSKIALIENLKGGEIRILCGGKDVNDDQKTLSEHGIRDMTKITILARLRGGAWNDDDEVCLGNGIHQVYPTDYLQPLSAPSFSTDHVTGAR